MLRSKLEIQEMSFPVRLGCHAAERQRPQMIQLSLRFYFLKPQAFFESDELDPAYCYDILSRQIAELLLSREFKTIENLALSVFRFLRHDRDEREVAIEVAIKKQPPLSVAHKGAVFTFGDLPAEPSSTSR